MEGKKTSWYANGQKSSENNYQNGDLVDSSRFEYYDTGQIQSEKNYKDDRFNGKTTLWYENGQKFFDGNYKDGKPDGKWTFWHKNGQNDEERNYKDNDLVDKTIFKYSYFTGHLKSEKKYKDGKCISGDC